MAKAKPLRSPAKRTTTRSVVEKPASTGPTIPALSAEIGVGSLAALAFANTLGHGLVWDDPISLNRWLPALPSWWSTFIPPAGIPQFPREYYRPLQLVSYQIDRAIGGGAAWPFHLSVVILHVAATILLFRVGKRLLGDNREGWWAALIAACLFAVHPIHSESVAWMAARPDVMVTCAGLAAMLAFWNSTWSDWTRTAVAAALIFVALLSKENAAALFLLVPASLFLISTPAAPRQAAPAPPSPATYLIFLVAAAAYLLLRFLGLGAALPSGTVIPPHLATTFVTAIGTYLRLLALPYPQNAFIPDVPIDAVTLATAVVGIACFAVLSWWAWQRNQRPLLFALLWLLLTLAPSLGVILTPPTAAIAERYLYLPSVGFCWAVGALCARLSMDHPRYRRATLVLVAGFVVLGFGLTVQRNRVWRDNFALWSDTAAKNPIDGLPLRSLAAATLERGDAIAAERLFQEALKRRNNPRGEFTIYNNLGTIALNRNDDAAAEQYYRKALALQPSADTLFNLGLIALRHGMSSERTPDEAARAAKNREARSLFEQAIAASPHDPDIHVALAQAAEALGDASSARTHFEQAMRLGLSPATEAAVRQRMAQLPR